MDDLVGVAGGVVEGAQQLEVVGGQADLLGQLAGGRGLGLLAVDVSEAGGDLEQVDADGRPELAHQRDRPVVVEREDPDGTRVVHDVAGELVPVRSHEALDGDRDRVAPVDDLLAERTEGRVRHSAVTRVSAGWAPLRSLRSSRSNRCGLRPSARVRAAATNARNSGAARVGRLLSSGWACVPTQNG